MGGNIMNVNKASDAHLERADLRGAHLEGANLTGAFLQEVRLEGACIIDDNIDNSRPTPLDSSI